VKGFFGHRLVVLNVQEPPDVFLLLKYCSTVSVSKQATV